MLISSLDNIRIVKFKKKFITPKYISWLNDSETVQFSEQRHVRHTSFSCHKYYHSIKNSSNVLWAIEFLEDKSWIHIGNIGATVDIPNKVADLAIIIGEKNYWGKGLGHKAWYLSATALLQTNSFDLITAGTMSVNSAMLKVFEKCNMYQDGKIRNRFIFEGRKVDSLLFSGDLISFENSEN